MDYEIKSSSLVAWLVYRRRSSLTSSRPMLHAQPPPKARSSSSRGQIHQRWSLGWGRLCQQPPPGDPVGNAAQAVSGTRLSPARSGRNVCPLEGTLAAQAVSTASSWRRVESHQVTSFGLPHSPSRRPTLLPGGALCRRSHRVRRSLR